MMRKKTRKRRRGIGEDEVKGRELELRELSVDDVEETLMVKKAEIETVEVEEIPALEPDET